MATSSGPIFRHIARTLGEAIESGAIAVGDLLPTEHELARRHGVSRHTVREALNDLRARGQIESKQGVGSIVVRRDARATYTETYSSIEELTRFAKGSPIRVLQVDDVIADEDLAAELRGRVGQAYVLLTGVRHDGDADEPPLCHVVVYVDGTYGGIRAHAYDLRAAVAETIETVFGLTIARIDQEISVDVLTDGQAAILGQTPATPALVIRRWYTADNGRIFEYAVSRYPKGNFVYRNVLVRKDFTS